MTKIYSQSFPPTKKTWTCTKTIINRFCLDAESIDQFCTYESLGISFCLLIYKFYGQRHTSTWYNIDNGLPQSSAKAIVKDKYGFIWISTENGLYGMTEVLLLPLIILRSIIFILESSSGILFWTVLRFSIISEK
jgi:hypothetical protein